MDSIKDRNSMDLIDAEDIKKRWQLVLNPYLFSKFACILSAALSQHHLIGFEIA